MIDKYEFADSLGGVREFFVDEAMKGSEEMKNTVVTKITVAAACVTLAAAAGLMAFFLGRGGIVTPAHIDAATDPQTSETATSPETTDAVTDAETTDAETTDADTTDAVTPDTDEPVELFTGKIGDFTVSTGVLVSYDGTETEPVVPEGIVAIAENAFSSSPAADRITKITVGKDVAHIDERAFFGLPSLGVIDVAEGNKHFVTVVGERMNSDPRIDCVCGVDEQIIFCFPMPGGDVLNGGSCIYEIGGEAALSYGEKTDVKLVVGNAVLDVFYELADGEYPFWRCKEIEYEGNSVCYSEPIDLSGGNFMLHIFETSAHELVLETMYYVSADIQYMTRDVAATLPESDFGGLFYRGDDGSLRYMILNPKLGHNDSYAGMVQTFYSGLYETLTSRDDYFGETGTVKYDGGLKRERDTIITVSDYFKMIGTDIDTWFEEFTETVVKDGDFYPNYDSLDELIEANRKKEN